MGYHMGHPERSRMAALEWMHSVQGELEADPGAVAGLSRDSNRISAHGGSSMGEMDAVAPLEYPLRTLCPHGLTRVTP